MRLHELYQTNQSSIKEAPVGAFKRGALKIGKAFGGSQSAGALDTANDANSLYKEFQQYLGRAGIKQPTAKDVRLFLQKKAISPKAVAKAMDDVVITKGQQELDFGPEFEKPKDSKRASEVVDSLKGLGAEALANLKKIAQVELKQRKKEPKPNKPTVSTDKVGKAVKGLGMLVAAGLVAGSLYTAQDVSSKYDDLSKQYQQQMQSIEDQKQQIADISSSKAEADARLSALNAEQERLKAEAEASKLAQAELQSQVAAEKKKLEQQRKAAEEAAKKAQIEQQAAKEQAAKMQELADKAIELEAQIKATKLAQEVAKAEVKVSEPSSVSVTSNNSSATFTGVTVDQLKDAIIERAYEKSNGEVIVDESGRILTLTYPDAELSSFGSLLYAAFFKPQIGGSMDAEVKFIFSERNGKVTVRPQGSFIITNAFGKVDRDNIPSGELVKSLVEMGNNIE